MMISFGECVYLISEGSWKVQVKRGLDGCCFWKGACNYVWGYHSFGYNISGIPTARELGSTLAVGPLNWIAANEREAPVYCQFVRPSKPRSYEQWQSEFTMSLKLSSFYRKTDQPLSNEFLISKNQPFLFFCVII